MQFTGTCENNETEKSSITPFLPNGALELLDASELEGQVFNITELLDAITNNDLERLAIILGSRSVNLLTKLAQYDDGTVLHFAAQNGLISVVHLLVIVGMELDIFDKEQNTALMLAILAEKNDVVQYLIRAGANKELKGTDGMTSLHLAAKCGNLQACEFILKSMLSHVSFVNGRDDGGWTPLVWASEHGFVNVAKYLIEKGADPLMRDVEHNIALHWAAFSGSTNVAELLLNSGCDVNTVNVHGDTPLHIGARQDMYDCIMVLLARGADVSIINKNNETPLDCAPPGSECHKVIQTNVQLKSVTGTAWERNKHLITNDISNGKELNPIQCIMSNKNGSKPRDFIYITKNCIGSEKLSIDSYLTSSDSCACRDRCSKEFCRCMIFSQSWYDNEGRLVPDFNYTDPPSIFECNDKCPCNAITCPNRVVQRGLTQRFQLFDTPYKGWGLRTIRYIPKGTFVCEYIGEILTTGDTILRDDDDYFFDLDNKENGSFCIDANYYGNVARFINHSCVPNLVPIKLFVEHQDLRFPRIALFSCRNIEIDEELCFDYGKKFWDVKNANCFCGSPECKYNRDPNDY